MQGFQKNCHIQTLDLTDNQLTDSCGVYILNMIKFMSEKRDNSQWTDGLRQQSSAATIGPKAGEPLSIFNINSSSKVLSHKSPSATMLKKATIKKQAKEDSFKGLRKLILRQNLLSDVFGKCLENCFCFDKYVKHIDLSHNKMSHECLKLVAGPKLRENCSLVCLDIRYNTGTTLSLLKQVALCMLKNIQIHRKNKMPVKP